MINCNYLVKNFCYFDKQIKTAPILCTILTNKPVIGFVEESIAAFSCVRSERRRPVLGIIAPFYIP